MVQQRRNFITLAKRAKEAELRRQALFRPSLLNHLNLFLPHQLCVLLHLLVGFSNKTNLAALQVSVLLVLDI